MDERKPPVLAMDEEDLENMGVDPKKIDYLDVLLDTWTRTVRERVEDDVDLRWTTLHGALEELGIDYDGVAIDDPYAESPALESLADAFLVLGRERGAEIVAEAIGYRSALPPAETVAAIREGRWVGLDESMDYRDLDALEGLVRGVLEAREDDPGHPLSGVYAWLEDGYGAGIADLWAPSGPDVSPSDIADLVNLLWSEAGCWEGAREEREEIARDVISALLDEGLQCAALNPSDVADELRDMCGLDPIWVSAGDVAAVRFPTTLLICDRGRGGNRPDDVTCSRHTFDAALEYLQALAEAEPGSPVPSFGGGRYRPDDDDIANSNLQWLCGTQGTTITDVLSPDSEAWGTPFGEALRQEILEAPACEAGWPYIAVLGMSTAGEILSLTAASRDAAVPHVDVLVRSAMVGIHDPVFGCGGVLDVGNWRGTEHMAPFRIPATMVGLAMPDGLDARRDTYDGWYTVEAVHGLVAECWLDSNTQQIWSAVPTLDGPRAQDTPAAERGVSCAVAPIAEGMHGKESEER